ncbi:hypothetical protein O3M35_000799 [Rhynocoris fuscipes]|uniref:ATP synthase subunit b n=1 Tax=Rhynocoris fuscipes TaxID=488301 RepID=A0AAW1DTC6_9HEMI
MLSRLALRQCLQMKQIAPSFIGSTRLTATGPKEGSERDLVNFPRPVRAEVHSKVRYGFVPEEWFEFFYKKTGVTGPYMFAAGLSTYLLSKEIWVVEHDFYAMLGFFGCVYLINRNYGQQISGYLDKQIDEIEAGWKELREKPVEALQDGIKKEQEAQWQAEGNILLMEAKRENVKMQLEATFRERAMQAYREVKKRLDYQSEKNRIEQMLAQKHMVQWVVSNVLKSISDAQEKENLKKCISDLQALSAKI